MKTILPILMILLLVSCNHTTNTKNKNLSDNSVDTLLVRIENKIDKSYNIGFYSRSITYCWVAGKDTLDFNIGLTEYVRDSSAQIRFFHNKPILFSDALNKLNDCVPLIEQDFNLDKLNSLYLEPPIFYKDLTTELSTSYNNQFGKKNIKYQKLNEFLMNSWLEERIGNFLKQIDKSTRKYGIEKFHLLEKEYYDEYIPNTDLNGYPSFSIHGMGISVIINEK